MEIINLDYSTKNIIVPGNRQYKLTLLNKIESVLQRMRWKLFFSKPTHDNLHDYDKKLMVSNHRKFHQETNYYQNLKQSYSL